MRGTVLQITKIYAHGKNCWTKAMTAHGSNDESTAQRVLCPKNRKREKMLVAWMPKNNSYAISVVFTLAAHHELK